MIYVMKVAYDGSHFVGVQRLPGKETVLGHLEFAVSKIFHRPLNLSAAGRTDTGVHSIGQVVAFRVDELRDAEKLTHSINSMARAPVAVLEMAILEDETNFHPRHSALSRTYGYLILDDCCYSQRLFWSSRAWCVGGKLDIPAMEAAAQHFVGEHDFTTYSYKPDRDTARVRRLSSIRFIEELLPPFFSGANGKGRLWRMEITADGFLRRMVRTVTSALVRVGLGLERPEELKGRLLAKDPKQGPPPAPPQGLYFRSVAYSPDPFELGRESGRYAEAGPSLRLSFPGAARTP
jgi:tRNA pseudouridine38-40 synthase